MVALAVVLGVTGMASAALEFVQRWWPLFALASVGATAVSAVMIRGALARKRAVAHRQRVLSSHIESTATMSPGGFEELIARLLRRDGWLDVRVIGGAGDLGADVIARVPDGRRLVAQCKRYAAHNLVSSTDMQRFLGTV